MSRLLTPAEVVGAVPPADLALAGLALGAGVVFLCGVILLARELLSGR